MSLKVTEIGDPGFTLLSISNEGYPTFNVEIEEALSLSDPCMHEVVKLAWNCLQNAVSKEPYLQSMENRLARRTKKVHELYARIEELKDSKAVMAGQIAEASF